MLMNVCVGVCRFSRGKATCSYPPVSIHSNVAWSAKYYDDTRMIGVMYAGVSLKQQGLDEFVYFGINAYWDSVGASGSKTKITFTDREWEAVQAGAISDSKLMKILNSSKSDEIIKRAMPKASTTLSSAKLDKAQAMLANGYSYAEIAKACGVPESTIYDNLNK